MTILYVILALVGIGLIIFIHEMGHFLAAKKVGVRVDRFAIGFDPPIGGRNLRLFTWRKGETEYVIGLIPFGGYVKLAGEAPEESDRPPAPDELAAKSVGERAVVFAAGATMNIVSAVFLFILAFSLGVSFPEPRVGNVLPGSPAWEAGLRPGDTVLAIDGREVNDFQEIVLAAAFSSEDETRSLRVLRPSPSGGEPRELEIALRPRWNPEFGFNYFGITPAPDPVIAAVDPGSPADRAGLRSGDRVVGIRAGGVETPPLAAGLLLDALREHLAVLPDRPLHVKIERSGHTAWHEIRRKEDPEAEPAPRLQVSIRAPFAGTRVRAVAPGSKAAAVLHPGDRLLALNGRTAGSAHWLVLADFSGAETLELLLEDKDGETRTETVRFDDFFSWNLRQEIFWGEHLARIGRLDADSPLRKLGFEPGDVIVEAAGEPVYEPAQLLRLLEKTAAEKLELAVQRGSERLRISADPSALRGFPGAVWRDVPPLSYVHPNGPAAQAGIVPGSLLAKIGEREVYTWRDVIEALKDLKPFEPVAVAWIDPDGVRHESVARPGARPYEDVGLAFQDLKKVVRTSIPGAFALGAQRTIIVAKHVFLTLRSLIRRDVSARNLSGPVGITHLFSRVAELGLAQLIYWMAIVSVNLGLLNLLPFPILDGGHLLFLLIEKIKGSPVDLRVQEWAMRVALFLILFLALYVTLNDIRRLLSW